MHFDEGPLIVSHRPFLSNSALLYTKGRFLLRARIHVLVGGRKRGMERVPSSPTTTSPLSPSPTSFKVCSNGFTSPLLLLHNGGGELIFPGDREVGAGGPGSSCTCGRGLPFGKKGGKHTHTHTQYEDPGTREKSAHRGLLCPFPKGVFVKCTYLR